MNVFVCEQWSGVEYTIIPARFAVPGQKKEKPMDIAFRPEFIRHRLVPVGGVPTVTQRKVGVYRPPDTDEGRMKADFLREHQNFKSGILVEMSEAKLAELKEKTSMEFLQKQMAFTPSVDAPEENSVVAKAVRVPKK